MTLRLLFSACFLIALYTNPTSAKEKLEEVVEYTLDFTPGEKLRVRTQNGGITVKTWDRDQIFIHAVKKATANSEEEAEELLETATIELEQLSTGLAIHTERPDKWKFFKRSNVSVDYTLTVPEYVQLDLQSVNGGISTPPTTGNAKSKTVNGSIRMNGTHGNVNAHTDNGKISLTEILGGVSAKTVNGEIRIEIEWQTEEHIQAETLNGKVRLTLPSDFQADLQVQTRHGSIHTDFPITVKGRIGKSLSGNINGGSGPDIQIQTMNGGIRIEQQ